MIEQEMTINPKKHDYYHKLQFTWLRNIFGFERDKKYLAWVKSLFPNMDIHHILGSTFSKKFTDYLVAPIEHEEHLTKAEYNKAEYCTKYFNISVRLLLQYAKEKEFITLDYSIPFDAQTGLYEPHKVNELIKLVASKCQST